MKTLSGWAARSTAAAVAALLLLGLGVGSATAVEVDIPAGAPQSGMTSAYWSAPVPASAEAVYVELPIASGFTLPADFVEVAVYSTAGDALQTTGAGMVFDGTRLVVDLPTVRSVIGRDVTEMQLRVRAMTGAWPAQRILHTVLSVTLVDDPATETTVTLARENASSVTEDPLWLLDEVVIPGGGALTVRGAPGFWHESGQIVTANYLSRVTGVPGVERRSVPLVPVQIAPDGSAATVVLPALEPGTSAVSFRWRRDGKPYGHLLVPIASPTQGYVRSVYQDLFGRDPDPTGLAGWSQALENGTPYGAVADGITYSDEFRLGLISDSYQQFLGRAPDTAGLYSWLGAMQGGMHIQQMETGFIASDEYYSRAGGTDGDWLAAMYEDILGRAPSTTEVNGWLPVVRKNGRIDVARQFLYSTEYLTHVVDGYYQWLLHRGIDPTGARDWVRAIQQGVRSEAIIAGIISSQEYRNNVGR